MIGVEPATHEIVLWAIFVIAAVILVVGGALAAHAHRNHKKLLDHVTKHFEKMDRKP